MILNFKQTHLIPIFRDKYNTEEEGMGRAYDCLYTLRALSNI